MTPSSANSLNYGAKAVALGALGAFIFPAIPVVGGILVAVGVLGVVDELKGHNEE